jgi:hypothetical protein
MKRWTGLSALLAVVALAGVFAVGAEKEADKEKPPAENGARQQLDLNDLGSAFQLMESGRIHEAPESLITAAALLKNVARAKIKDLDVTPTLWKGKEKADDKPIRHKASDINLNKEAKDLIAEAQVLAPKAGIKNIVPLTKAVEERKLDSEGVGEIMYYGGVLGGGETLEIPVKVDAGEVTKLAVRSTEALRISVTTKDGKETLASSVTSAGNVPFKVNKDEAVTRAVIIRRPLVVRPAVVVRPVVRPVIVRPRVWVRPGVIVRSVGAGDTEVVLRITNPSKKYDADFDLFLR